MTHRTTLATLWLIPLLAAAPAAADEQEQQAQAMLQRLGRTFNLQTGRIDLYESAVTDADMPILAGLNGLRILNLNVTQVSDRGLAHLASAVNLETLYLAGTKITDAGLQHLQGMPRLQSLVLRGTPVGDVGLAHLRNLKSLEVLHVEETRITDAGLKHLAGLTNLSTLDLRGTSVGDAGLEHLKGLTALKTLELRGTRATVAGLKDLRGAKQLRCCLDLPAAPETPAQTRALAELGRAGVQVASTPARWRSIADFDERRPPYAGLTVTVGRQEVTDQDLAHLADLPQVQVLMIRSHNISNAGLAHVKGLTALEEIDLLCMTSFNDTGLAHFKELTNLRRLILDGTSVTDAGLVHLHESPRLEYLRLGKHVTAQGVRDLQKHLPKTHIVQFGLGIR